MQTSIVEGKTLVRGDYGGLFDMEEQWFPIGVAKQKPEPLYHVDGANVIVSKIAHKCDCSRQQLMRDGCKCGGI